MKSSPEETVTAPLKKSIVVDWSRAEAFRRFTDGIDGWWPVDTHSVGPEQVKRVVLEGHVGGRIYEEWNNGEKRVWGSVLEWESPDMLRFTWHPGRDSDSAQEVEVRFTAVGQRTRVDLTHYGWETLGEKAVEIRRNYDTGWDFVLGRYLES